MKPIRLVYLVFGLGNRVMKLCIETDLSLQSVSTQEIKKFVKQTSGPYINGGELNHYTNRLRDKLQKFLQPAAG